MTTFRIIQLADQAQWIADTLRDLVAQARVGEIPPEVLAPLVPILDARIPPIIDALEGFPRLRPDLPPWRTSPNPDPEPVSILANVSPDDIAFFDSEIS